eukprot:6346965-Amphidinium_carterae.1
MCLKGPLVTRNLFGCSSGDFWQSAQEQHCLILRCQQFSSLIEACIKWHGEHFRLKKNAPPNVTKNEQTLSQPSSFAPDKQKPINTGDSVELCNCSLDCLNAPKVSKPWTSYKSDHQLNDPQNRKLSPPPENK